MFNLPYYLTKVLPYLLMPVFIVLFTAVLALIFVATGRRKASVLFLLTSILVLWLSSLPAVAVRLAWSLQGQYPPLIIEEVPASDCLVVLGGAISRSSYPGVDIEITDATDRVYQAAKLFRAGKAKTIIVAAGNQPWNLHSEPEAKLIRNLLVEWGVTRQAIVLDTMSKNTRENAINAVELLREQDCQSNLLVTSALHMPRAIAAFQKAGADMVPVPVDTMSGDGEISSIVSLIPQVGALAVTSGAIREWMGIWVYRWREWN